MKKNIKQKETSVCHKCKNTFDIKKLYRFTWRYTDKERKYKGSKRFIIHTGYTYLCKHCLQTIIKL